MRTFRNKTLAIIMGGGAGTRLFPLTQKRAKPAVPLGGKYRLVDIPISNCLNAGLRQVYVLTQFNSESLNRHIADSYQFDRFTKSFIEILAAQQTPEDARWYQGTADAVRQNLRYFLQRPYEYYLVLSGDHLYRMDHGDLLHEHVRTGADVPWAPPRSTGRRFRALGFCRATLNDTFFALKKNPKTPSSWTSYGSRPICSKSWAVRPIPSSTRARWASMSLTAKS